MRKITFVIRTTNNIWRNFQSYFGTIFYSIIFNTNQIILRLKRCRSTKKLYFPGPGISWKSQKDQVNIIFTSTFWLKKDPISHHWKVQNKNFTAAQNKNVSVISKYHISINFLPQKRPYFPSAKSSKQELVNNQ